MYFCAPFRVFLQFRFFVVIDMIPSTHRVTDSVLAVVNCHGQSRNLALRGGVVKTCKSVYYNKHIAKKGESANDLPLFVFFCPQDRLSDLQGYSSVVPTENILFQNKKQINFNDKNNKLCI